MIQLLQKAFEKAPKLPQVPLNSLIVAMDRGDDVYRSAIQFFDSPFVRLISLDEEQV